MPHDLTFTHSVWPSALGGELRLVAKPARPLQVWIARPQRLRRDLLGRIDHADATGDTWNPGPGRLVEWLYRSGAHEPDYCHVLLGGETLPRLYPAAWVHHATHLVSLRSALGQALPARRTA